jgi:HEAT repeat protein
MKELQDLLAQLTSGEDERAEAAIAGLAALGKEAVPNLQQLMTSADPDRRWWAVRALAEIKAGPVPALLLQALTDADLAVRQCAALALRRQPAPQALPELINALDGPDPLLAGLAADALTALGSEAVLALLEVMAGGKPGARLLAVRSLATIGDTRAIPALFNALNEESMMMEYWANEGLERMGVGMVYLKP